MDLLAKASRFGVIMPSRLFVNPSSFRKSSTTKNSTFFDPGGAGDGGGVGVGGGPGGGCGVGDGDGDGGPGLT